MITKKKSGDNIVFVTEETTVNTAELDLESFIVGLNMQKKVVKEKQKKLANLHKLLDEKEKKAWKSKIDEALNL